MQSLPAATSSASAVRTQPRPVALPVVPPSARQSAASSSSQCSHQQQHHQPRPLAAAPAAGKGFGSPATAKKGAAPAPKPNKASIAEEAPCPCGAGKQYQACCGPYHKGGVLPPTPEATLRSRYSAYFLKFPEYIVATTHPDSPEFAGVGGSKVSYTNAVKRTMAALEPLKLTIIEATAPAPAAPQAPASEQGQQGQQQQQQQREEAYVTFKLRRRMRDPSIPRLSIPDDEITEKSHFVRNGKRWMLMASEFLDAPQQQQQQ